MNAPLLNSSSALTSFPKVGSDLYKCFLRSLVDRRSPVRSLEKVAQRTETQIAEGVIVKAFSNELTKLGIWQYLAPLLRMGGAELAWQVGKEGIGRLTQTSHRSVGDLLKDTAVGTATHGIAKGIGDKVGPGFIQNATKMFDPWGHGVKSRLGFEGLETGLKMLAGSNKKPSSGLGTPGPVGQMGKPNNGSNQLSYDQLRRMDPRVVSTQYFS